MNKSLKELIVSHRLEKYTAYLLAVQSSVIKIAAREAEGPQLFSNASRFNGGSFMPPGDTPPMRDGKPLSMLAMLKLSDVHEAIGKCDLPPKGLLSFWYDCDNQPWGLYPTDKSGFAVTFVPDESTEMVRVGDNRPPKLPTCLLTFSKQVQLPEPRSFLEGAPEELLFCGDYADLVRSLRQPDSQHHQLLGRPTVVQDPMEMDCQMASNDVKIVNGYWDRKAMAEMKSGVGDWRLLLQLGSEGAPGWMWGDLGLLYFWIRKQDLAAAKFDRCWCRLQCG